DRSVLQRGGPTPQGCQIVQRIKNLLVPAVAAFMPRHHLPARYHLDLADVAFDRYRLIGATTRHAVAVAVEMHRLVLIDLGRLHDAGVEGIRGQWQGSGAILQETLAD